MNSITLKNLSDINESEVIEVLRTDNIISLKIKLNSRIYVDEKNLKLYKQYDRASELDNNIFVPDGITDLYYQETEEETDDIILYIKRNYYVVPKYIQISRSATIRDFKNILVKLFQVAETIQVFNEDGSLLENDKTLRECNLDDNSKIKIWKGDSLRLTVNICDPLVVDPLVMYVDPQAVIPDRMLGQLNVLVTDTILEVKQNIMNNFGQCVNLQLFSETAFLEDRKQLLQYPIENEFKIFCVDMKKRQAIEIEDKVTDGKYAKIFHGKMNSIDKCVVYQYDISSTNLKNFKVLKYEIVTRLKLPYETSRFVQLLSMYEEQNHIFIAMEYMEGGSLRSRLSELNEERINHYSYQIIDGLSYMHAKKIIHRNLNCGSVLLDGNDNAKLCNFHLSKFLFDKTTEQLLKGIKGSKIDDDACWVAPEVMIGEPYGLKADIWSFGVTIIEMITRKRPYPDCNPVQASHKIVGDRTIVYDQNIYPNSRLNGIIGSCIRPKQNDRANAWDLRLLLNPNA